jgi:hypothetical protein|tara:strand:- start:398 stop:781 length:384 start_codon:yes stop_codon:yes gene_type:complete
MFKKGNKIYSIFKMKCPKCHETDLFINKNPFKLDGFFGMPKQCSVCHQKFELEPGFYYGSMYVSYGVTIAYLVSVFVAMTVLYPTFSLELYLGVGISTMILLTPYFFKICRAIWINFFVGFDPPKRG